MLRVGWEVGLLRDKEQVIRGHGSSDPPLRVGVSGTFASASCVSPLLAFLTHVASQGNSWIIGRVGARPKRGKYRARPGDRWVQF